MKLKIATAIVMTSISLHASAALETESDKLSYSLGALMAEQLKQFGTINSDALTKGIRDTLEGKETELSKQEMLKVVETARKEDEKKQQEKLAEEARTNLEAGQQFLKENARKPGVITMDNGLQYRIIKEGTGAKPKESSEVTVHYEGKLLDGKIFDSSYERGQPATFRLNQVIRGWNEGLQEMPEGSTWELFVPAELAYGPGGIPGRIAPNSMLTFKVELMKVGKEDKKK
ncbi:FKBP-type peptidyl-prolyl cis-trans isomerase [Endozoicomonas sp. OPT23]|uniref:FKBP-type peptidyl-prolyl cis-trans isomerase n=1 Tax=Endozoicomonas sp. OPT23 TaxID=2072845 RepID=UPI001890DC77|nr:FKBP-type peptidyl-prolyl cis-trans isomerase [Endozoicomonas sp. OPT23]